MKRSTFSINFFIKRNKPMRNGESPIYIRITVNGQRVEFSTKRSINPEHWDPAKGRSCKKIKRAIDLNEYLDDVLSRIYEIRKELEHEGEEITSQNIQGRYLCKNIKRKKILELYQEHNDHLEERISKGVAYGTWERHRTSRSHFEAFVNNMFHKPDINANIITKSILEEYYHYLITVKNCANNTSIKYLMNLSKILNIAVERGFMKLNPYPKLKLRKDEVVKDFLTDEELKSIMNKDFMTERLTEVRDVFVFSCLTGLAFIDIKTLKKEHLVEIYSEYWILKPRCKSNVISRIPLLPKARQILAKYQYYANSTGFLLPVRTNQKMNEYLKEIGALSGIEKKLTTHMARHTFATTVTLSNNVSIESVSKMLGHTNLAMTQRYARILDKKINGEMALIAGKY